MIFGKRIRLRKIERLDLPQFVEWLNDPEVRRGLGAYLPLSMAEEERWFEKMLEGSPEEHPLAIEIREGDGWRLIGSTSFFDIHRRSRHAEFGIVIGDKSIWNQGYGTEAAGLMLDHGFGTLNLHRIYLRVFSNNPRAMRAYEKAGYKFEGTLREAEYRDGEYISDHIMSVLKQEWEARKNTP